MAHDLALTQDMMAQVFKDAPHLTNEFIVGDLAKAGRLSSNFLNPRRDNLSFVLDTIDVLNKQNYNGRALLHVATTVVCAAEKLSLGELDGSKKDFVIKNCQTSVCREQKRKIAKDAAAEHTTPASDGEFDSMQTGHMVANNTDTHKAYHIDN